VRTWCSLSRRRLAGLLVALASLSGAPFIGSWAPSGGIESRRALLAVLDDPRKARTMGIAYLGTLPPAERSAERLATAICLGASIKNEALAALEVRRLIHFRVRRDFAEGALVVVDGWFLSVTEARLYALAALA